MFARYILRFDDIAPGMAWSKFLPLKRHLEALNIKCVLGVVPECRDPQLTVEPHRADFFDLVRAWKTRGDTIAQHGTYHLYQTANAGMLGAYPRSEFAGLSYQEQLLKIETGKSILTKERVWSPYFMAPAHSFDLNTLRALKSTGFDAVSDGVGFHPYAMEGIKLIPQLLGRPFPFPFGVVTICIHINLIDEQKLQTLMQFVEKHRQQFVNFHDVCNEPLVNSWQSAWLRSATNWLLTFLRSIRSRQLQEYPTDTA